MEPRFNLNTGALRCAKWCR